jgi:hypothetical protein
MISPASSNRALPVRVYVLGYWLAAAVGCAIWARQLGHVGPVMVWGVFGAILFGIQILTAVSERDEWGPRVARRIPRRTPLRALAFLFYSGAAGGIVFGVIGGGLTVAGMLAWHELNPSFHGPPRWWQPVQMVGLILGYTYCYGMSAVLVRRLGRGTAMRPGFTWLVALILFGLGCTLPFIIRYSVESRSSYGYPGELMWLYLPSPVVMIENLIDRGGGSHDELTIAFVAVWAVAVTILNAGWLVRQVANFRPPKATAAAESPT